MPIDRSTPPLASLFQELILEHYKRPRNRGPLLGADRKVHMNNPTCGDEVLLQVKLEGDRIGELRFIGEGCSISQSSISMMTELLRGKSRAEAAALAQRFTAMMHGDAGAAASDATVRDSDSTFASSFSMRLRVVSGSRSVPAKADGQAATIFPSVW